MNQLVFESYSNQFLNQAKVNKIVKFLSKSDLKQYINALKLEEKKKSLIVSAPVKNQNLARFTELFPNKKIIFKIDPSLMLGIKIVDNDLVYEFTLKSSLDKIVSYMEQNYD